MTLLVHRRVVLGVLGGDLHMSIRHSVMNCSGDCYILTSIQLIYLNEVLQQGQDTALSQSLSARNAKSWLPRSLEASGCRRQSLACHTPLKPAPPPLGIRMLLAQALRHQVVHRARIQQPRVQLVQPRHATHLHGRHQLVVQDCCCRQPVTLYSTGGKRNRELTLHNSLDALSTVSQA